MEKKHMTISEAIKKVVDLAISQIGYKEGDNNYNKYAADPRMTQAYGWSLQNQPWCAVFVNWLFIDSFGLSTGKQMTYGCSPSCFQQAQLYKNGGAWNSSPQVGDQVFFYANRDINHTGIVVDIQGTTVVTVEGNCSDGVCRNSYDVESHYIAGFGRPNWNLVANSEEPKQTGLTVDGECGQQTWAALAKKMPLVKKGSTGWAVVALQAMLNFLGADLDTDGDCGKLTENEIREFQGGKL